MSGDDIQRLISEFNKQFNELRKDLNIAMEKVSQRISMQSEANISCAKDIEAVRLLFEEKMDDMKRDIDGVGNMVRTQRENILNSVDLKIKKSDLTTRLTIALSLMSGMGAMILFLLNKFF